MNKRVQTTLKLSPEEARELDSIADELGVSRSAVLRCACVPALCRDVADLVSRRAGLARAEAIAMLYGDPPAYVDLVVGVEVPRG